MFHDFRAALRRSAPTLAEDVAGAFAIVVLLVVGLYLPNLI